MRRQWFIWMIVLCFFCSLFPNEAKAMSVSAKSAILMEQTTGRVLFEKDAHTKRRIASITKIMTAILAIESGKWEELVTVSERAVRTEEIIYLFETRGENCAQTFSIWAYASFWKRCSGGNR